MNAGWAKNKYMVSTPHCIIYSLFMPLSDKYLLNNTYYAVPNTPCIKLRY